MDTPPSSCSSVSDSSQSIYEPHPIYAEPKEEIKMVMLVMPISEGDLVEDIKNYQVENALAESNIKGFDLCSYRTVKDENLFAQLCPRTRRDWSNNYCDRPYAPFFLGSEDESHHFKCKKCCVDAWITRDRDTKILTLHIACRWNLTTENEHQYWLSEISEYLSMRGSCLKIITEEVYRKDEADHPNEIQALEDANAVLQAELQQLKSCVTTSSVPSASADNVYLVARQKTHDLSL